MGRAVKDITQRTTTMIHFPANPSCVTRSKDNDARISRVADLDEFRDWRRTFPEAYCPECANEAKVRTDSERYAELRQLVECWQKNLGQAHKDALIQWKHR